MFKKSLLVAWLTLLIATTTNWAYTEVNCSTDPVYSQYSCSQCFNWWEVSKWTNISFLDDLWVNDTWISKIMYKEEQTMPVMNALNASQLTKMPNTDAFWEYTPEFEALNNKEYSWYVLPAWKTISWIKSSMWSSYLVENAPKKWDNVWILVFDVLSHNILENWEIATNDAPHKECVVYTSAESYVPPVVEQPAPEPKPVPEQMTKVETGPKEVFFFSVLFAILIAWIVLNRKVILEKIKK